MSDCVFCMIAGKEIPSNIAYEDDKIIAFHDLDPQAPVHVLVIPKKHITSLDATTDEDRELLGYLLCKIKDIARDLGKVYLDGVRVFARLDNLLRRFALAGAELEVRRLVNVDERVDRFIRIVRQHDERSFFRYRHRKPPSTGIVAPQM